MIRRIADLTRTINALHDELAGLVNEVAPQLLAERGVGVLIAAKLIGEIAGIERFTTDAQLARLGACAPIPVSSGRTDRHRLDPGGNRQLNHAIHMLALTKLSHDPQTALYIAKQRARGKTNKEAIRSLKRHLIRRVYNLLKHPSQTQPRSSADNTPGPRRERSLTRATPPSRPSQPASHAGPCLQNLIAHISCAAGLWVSAATPLTTCRHRPPGA
jgi:transposase